MDSKKTFTVLIAEDDHALGVLVERTLNQAGFATHRVFNGKQTLDFCEGHSPDDTFLLLDYQLGDLTAREIVCHLKEHHLNFPFIVVTGYGNESVAVEMMKLGADDYLVKSERSIELLVPVLSQAIERKVTKQSLEQTRRALHTAHQAIMATDNGIVIAELSEAACPIIYYNPAFETITGYQCSSQPTLQEWLGSYTLQQPGLQDILEAVQHRQSTHVQLNLDHHYHDVNLCFIAETVEQKGAFIGIVSDVTQRHLSEMQIGQLRRQLEQTQRLAIAGQVSKELAHEIGQPLTHLSSKIQFMASKNTTDPDDFSVILKHIDRITSLLRSFSTDESDSFSPTTVSVHSVMKSILELCPCDNGVSVSARIPENLPNIVADKAKITQVLLNLLTNAMEACKPKGAVHFSAETRTLPETEEQYVAISVKDTGTGIAPQNLQKIFDPFFSTKSKSRDRGLGLSICQSIAFLHHGWIEVKSQYGHGSCLTLVLPLKQIATRSNVTSETYQHHLQEG